MNTVDVSFSLLSLVLPVPAMMTMQTHILAALNMKSFRRSNLSMVKSGTTAEQVWKVIRHVARMRDSVPWEPRLTKDSICVEDQRRNVAELLKRLAGHGEGFRHKK